MTVVLVGNPKPRSRTYEAATLLAQRLTGAEPELAIDLADIGPALLDRSDTSVNLLVETVAAAELLVVASPTYKATYTGLLKCFLDRIPGGGLAGVTAVPLMLGAAWKHAMAADLLLKPVLVELGARCPTRGLFLLDSDYTNPPELDAWLTETRAVLPSRSGGLS